MRDKDFVIENGTLIEYRGMGGDVIIPDTVERIFDLAFENCSTITSLHIPESVTDIINEHGFYGCPATFYVDPKNEVYKSDDGIIYSKDGFRVVACSRGKSGDLMLSELVHVVDYAAFAFCDKLTSIHFLSDSLYMGDEAFYGCSALKELIIPANTVGNDEYMLSVFDADVVISVYDNYLNDEFDIESAIFKHVTKIYFDMPMANAISTDFYRQYVEKIGLTAEMFYLVEEEYEALIPPTDKNGSFVFGNLYDFAIGDDGAIYDYYGPRDHISIPLGLEAVDFMYWEELMDGSVVSSVYVPKEIVDMEGLGMLLTEAFQVDEGNQHFSSLNGDLYNKDQTELIRCAVYEREQFVLPKSVKTIRYYGLTDCDCPVIIPATVENIEENALDFARNITIYVGAELAENSYSGFYGDVFEKIDAVYFEGTLEWMRSTKFFEDFICEFEYEEYGITIYYRTECGDFAQYNADDFEEID